MKNPVETVTWFDAVEYCNRLSTREGFKPYYNIVVREGGGDKNIIRADVTENFASNGYRLPNRKEWVYAAIGGKNGRITGFAGSDNIDDVAWYEGNSEGKTHRVGTKKANMLGIYDMSGNVYERTNTAKVDEKIKLGGGWSYSPMECKVSAIGLFVPDGINNALGFRVLRIF